jgi:hypothetical protein
VRRTVCLPFRSERSLSKLSRRSAAVVRTTVKMPAWTDGGGTGALMYCLYEVGIKDRADDPQHSQMSG